MTELIIKSDQAEAVRVEVEAAIESHRRAIRYSAQKRRERLGSLEEKYGFTTDALLDKERDPLFDDSNQELIEWLGEAETLERLQAELKLLDNIRVC